MIQSLLRQGGLRARIVLWLLLPTVTILSVVAVLAYGTFRRGTEELVFARSEAQVRLLSSQISSELAIARQPLRAIAMSAHPEGLTVLGPVLAEAWPLGDLGFFDGGVLVLDTGGTIVSATPGLVSMVGRVFPSSTVAGVNQGSGLESVYSNVRHGDVPDANVISVEVPVLGRDGTAIGVLVGLFTAQKSTARTSALYHQIWDTYIGRALDVSVGDSEIYQPSQHFPRPAVAYLLDANGVVVFHPDTYLIGDDVSGGGYHRRVLAGDMSPVRTFNMDGNEVVAAAAAVPGTSWVLISEVSWDQQVSAAQPSTQVLFMLLILAVLVPVVVVFVSLGGITRPLARLTQAAKDVAGGQFDQRIDMATGDELQVLAEQFNVMSSELQASYATLEQRVEARTHELSTLNAIASVVSRSLDLEEVLSAALAETLTTMDLYAGAAFRVGPSGLHLIAHQGFSESLVAHIETLSLSMRDHANLSVAGLSLGVEDAVMQRQIVVCHVADYPESVLAELLLSQGVALEIAVPLMAKGQVLGAFSLTITESTLNGSTPSGWLTPEMCSLLASIGQQVGLALENAALYEQAEQVAAAAERNRLARDLHDAVSQTLFTASLISEAVPRLWERDVVEAQRQMATLQRLTRGALAEMRTLLLELRPTALVETALPDLLGHLARAFEARCDSEVSLEVEGYPVSAPPVEVKIALYRIVQEALANVSKHANADHVEISLWSPDGGPDVALRVSDDGCGFDTAGVTGDHFGLITMRERAASIGASLAVESVPGRGTYVETHWRAKPDDGAY